MYMSHCYMRNYMNMGQESYNMVQHGLLCGTSTEVMHKLASAGIQNLA